MNTCSFVTRCQNIAVEGFAGVGKFYLACAIAKQGRAHRYRAHFDRMPDLAETRAIAKEKPAGQIKLLRKYAVFSLLVIDEWLLDH